MDIVFAFAEKTKAEFISLRVIDEAGQISDFTTTLGYFSQNFQNLEFDNVKFIPDIYNFFLDPFKLFPTIVIMSNRNIQEDSRGILSEFKQTSPLNLTTKIEFSIFPFDSLEEDEDIAHISLINIMAEIVKSLEAISIKTTYHCLLSGKCRIVFNSNDVKKACDDLVNAQYVIENTLRLHKKVAVFSDKHPITIDIEFGESITNYKDNISFFQENLFDLDKLHFKHDSATLLLDLETNVYFYLPAIIATYLNEDNSQSQFLHKLSSKF